MAYHLRLLALTLLLLCSFSLSVQAENRPPAPSFSLPAVNGTGKLSLADFKGKVVYLDFWDTWCAPCRQSFPWMDRLYEEYKDQGLVVLAVGIDHKGELLKKFVQELEPAFPVAHDNEGKVYREYGLRAMPTTYLIDRSGRIAFTQMGFREDKKAGLREKLEALLRE